MAVQDKLVGVQSVSNKFSTRRAWSWSSLRFLACLPGLVWLAVIGAVAAEENAKTFATPEDAVSALAAAVNTTNMTVLRDLFGPSTDEILSPDKVQAESDLTAFAAALNTSQHLTRNSESQYELDTGTNHWPFPIPIRQKAGRWFFDTDAGREELTNRRIGRNELATLQTVRAYVAAQREYASQDRNGDDVLEYAQKLRSTPGRKDGLYWEPELDGTISPLGPLAAHAQAEGYEDKPDDDAGPQPFHGYFFRILTRQGKNAPAGKYNYIINGYLLAGFALVAWPADHGATGVMTFIVNQQGRVYQKDLGPKTDKLSPGITEYDPDSTWRLSSD